MTPGWPLCCDSEKLQEHVPESLQPVAASPSGPPSFFFNILFIRERHREKETQAQAEGEADSMQGAQCGTGSPVSRFTPRAEDGAKLLSHSPPPQVLKVLEDSAFPLQGP